MKSSRAERAVTKKSAEERRKLNAEIDKAGTEATEALSKLKVDRQAAEDRGQFIAKQNERVRIEVRRLIFSVYLEW